jgi:hypothetical protein
MNNVQPHVVLQIAKKDKDYIDIVEKKGRKTLLVKTGKFTYIRPREICAMGIQLHSLFVLFAEKPLKLECFRVPPSCLQSALVKIKPVGIHYGIFDLTGGLPVTVLNRPGPIKVRDGKATEVQLVNATPIPELSTPYVILCNETLYAEVRWEEDFPGYLAPLTPVCCLGFSFLNDQGEWEPLMDFEVV